MKQDIRIFIASRGDPEALARGLRDEFAQAEVITDPATIGPDPVPYVIVGKPEAGVIAAVPGMELLLRCRRMYRSCV